MEKVLGGFDWISVIFLLTHQIESLQVNTERLKAYKARLIVFPRKSSKKVKKGDSAQAETSVATQLKGDLFPVSVPKPKVERVKITEEMKKFMPRQAIGQARLNERMIGIREKRKKDAENKDKKKDGGEAAEAPADD